MQDEIDEMRDRLFQREKWGELEEELLEKRLKWFDANKDTLESELHGTDVEKAYQLMLRKLGIDESELPIATKTTDRIVLHSQNFCPVIGACDFLGLDTREVCKEIFERPMEVLMQRINPRLKFTRNYDKIRPRSPYCEEVITLG